MSDSQNIVFDDEPERPTSKVGTVIFAAAAVVMDQWAPEAVVMEVSLPDGEAVDAVGRWPVPAVVLGRPGDELSWPPTAEVVERGAAPDVVLAALQRLGVPVLRG